jgi:hypothetical protein
LIEYLSYFSDTLMLFDDILPYLKNLDLKDEILKNLY